LLSNSFILLVGVGEGVLHCSANLHGR
jgi:hypothetical protein